MKNMKTTRSLSLIGMLGMAVLAFASCTKPGAGTGSSAPTPLNIYLTDAPGDYKAVWVDVQKIYVNAGTDTSSSDTSGWVEAPVLRPGLYNLLDLRNGVDTVLAGVTLPAGHISQIRLVLGSDNSLVLDDGTTVPLTTPSGQQSGVKLNVDATLTPGVAYALELDFDAGRSVVKAGNSGSYLLKPVIRTFAKAASGALDGVVLPDSAHASVWAVNAADTLSAIPDSTGYYKIWGAPSGTYSLVFAADTTTGYRSDTLGDVMVSLGNVTHVDTVTLHK